MEPVEYLRILRRRWVVVVAAAVLAGGLALASTPDQTEQAEEPGIVYTARHTLLREVLDERTAQVSVERVALFATTGEVPRRVVERLGLDADPAVVAAQVQVAGDSRLGTLLFTVRHEDGDYAAELADAFAEETIAYFDEQAESERQTALQLANEAVNTLQERVREFDVRLRDLPEDSVEAELARSERDALIRQYGATFDRYQQLLSAGSASIGYVSLEDATAIPEEQAGIQAPSDAVPRTALGAGVGLVLGMALALLLDRTDTRVRTRQGAEQAFGFPVVATIPSPPRGVRRRREVVTASQPASLAAEAYRILRLSLQLMPRWKAPPHAPATAVDESRLPQLVPLEGARRGGDGTRFVLLTSPGPGEGKTVTAANLAVSCAEGGKSVLLLDCDFRGGDLHRYFSLDSGPGVQDFLAGEGELADLARPTAFEGVHVVPHGGVGGNPAELLQKGGKLLRAAGALADVVIIDAGPLLAVNDPGALVPAVDTVVLLCRSGRTSASSARLATELLARLEAPVLGVALVGVHEGMFPSSSSRGAVRASRRLAGVHAAPRRFR